jgi:hypothetical protein
VTGAAPQIPDFSGSPLVTALVQLDGWLRIYKAVHLNPLGYGKSPSRFSDPRRLAASKRFAVIYFNTTLQGCFVEAVLRDKATGTPGTFLLEETEIQGLNVAEVHSTRALKLVDLRGNGLVRMRLPTDAARATAQDLGRACSLEFYRHRERPDGIIYASRLNGSLNVAVYGRALRALRCQAVMPLATAAGFHATLDAFNVAIRPVLDTWHRPAP